MTKSALGELDDILDELETFLKNPQAESDLAGRGINISLALTIVDGLRAYAHGDKSKAVLELETVADEIAARMARAGKPS
jgi:hypothetical protein